MIAAAYSIESDKKIEDCGADVIVIQCACLEERKEEWVSRIAERVKKTIKKKKRNETVGGEKEEGEGEEEEEEEEDEKRNKKPGDVCLTLPPGIELASLLKQKSKPVNTNVATPIVAWCMVRWRHPDTVCSKNKKKKKEEEEEEEEKGSDGEEEEEEDTLLHRQKWFRKCLQKLRAQLSRLTVRKVALVYESKWWWHNDDDRDNKVSSAWTDSVNEFAQGAPYGTIVICSSKNISKPARLFSSSSSSSLPPSSCSSTSAPLSIPDFPPYPLFTTSSLRSGSGGGGGGGNSNKTWTTRQDEWLSMCHTLFLKRAQQHITRPLAADVQETLKSLLSQPSTGPLLSVTGHLDVIQCIRASLLEIASVSGRTLGDVEAQLAARLVEDDDDDDEKDKWVLRPLQEDKKKKSISKGQKMRLIDHIFEGKKKKKKKTSSSPLLLLRRLASDPTALSSTSSSSLLLSSIPSTHTTSSPSSRSSSPSPSPSPSSPSLPVSSRVSSLPQESEHWRTKSQLISTLDAGVSPFVSPRQKRHHQEKEKKQGEEMEAPTSGLSLLTHPVNVPTNPVHIKTFRKFATVSPSLSNTRKISVPFAPTHSWMLRKNRRLS